MYFDKETIFSLRQAVNATAPATDTVDLGPAQFERAEELELFASVENYSGSGSLTIELSSSDELNADGSLKNPRLAASYPVGNAALLNGGKVVAARPPRGLKRYAGLNYKVEGALGGGVITAALVLDI